jgi:SAM-dependent methyltransferase
MLLAVALQATAAGSPVRVSWTDVRPLQAFLGRAGVDQASLDAYVARLAETHRQRVREGDLEHLVYFLLQSPRITDRPPIEPALSARALVDSLDPGRRAAWLAGEGDAVPALPADVRTRIMALVRAVDRPGDDPRLRYFHDLLEATYPEPRRRTAGLAAEYQRVMRFLYQKEFVAQREATPATAVAELYRARGLSTDTAVEAVHVVHLGLAVAKGLAPERRVRRVLIVGPGLDLAPRTAFDESTPPQSYQPWAVMDAVVAVGLARLSELEVVAADINPRVIAHLRDAVARPPALRVATSLQGPTLSLSPDYVDYVDRFGGAIGEEVGRSQATADGQRLKTVRVSAAAARALRAEPLDVVTERLAGERFDLVVATNVLPYFDDPQLALAMANIAAMLAPGGIFVHNEQRPILGEMADALGLPLAQSRHAVIATVAGARTPLYDSVFLHVRRAAR